MKKFSFYFLLLICVAILASFSSSRNDYIKRIKFPYQKQGLTERQAAAHLLSRFTYGATQSMIDDVVKQGLENWFLQQLNANLPDETLNEKLKSYDILTMSNETILNKFPKKNDVIKMAVTEGVIDKEDLIEIKANKKDSSYKKLLENYMKQKVFLPEQELMRQQINQKILRASYSNNQLLEVMADFWYNHFNISATKNQCLQFIPVYERENIRKNSLNNFEDLLLSTAKSPAMLLYLDNFSSSGTNELFVNFNKRNSNKKQNNNGLNENYARELMELHTLGVDGGYTQSDVTEVARILTGWTIYPLNDYAPGANFKKMLEKFKDKFSEKGFVREGDFLFAANRHDSKEKIVLGRKFKEGGGYEEGVELLKMLATHTSTAKFISKKLAIKFVSDNPPQSLIDKMTQTFLTTKGNIKQVLITMATSSEFWSKDALREKIKSPFELAISAVRILHADIKRPMALNNWITTMGQKIYFYQAPTGFPDNAAYWVNTGALLNRMNFGLAIAANKIAGVKVNLTELNQNKEPESAEKALEIYAKILLPERNITSTIKRVQPLLQEQNLIEKINKSTAKNEENNNLSVDESTDKYNHNSENNFSSFGSNPVFMQVVGVILGSPEFQRR
ncbi:MAG: DUF1800 domain-containing protein [Chitinophagales bacterium]|nr:DUF1800 domain-containing protein [Chitinophagales bacterium]